MSVTKLPSGMWRAQVYDPSSGRNISVSKVLGGAGTFRTKTEAKTAREQARVKLGVVQNAIPTVSEFRERWLTDPLFARPKLSTMLHHDRRTREFVKKYGELRMDEVGDRVVGEWLATGRRWTVGSLSAMFNDASSRKAGRIIPFNPWADLGIERSNGNAGVKPPSPEQMETMLQAARDLTPPSFAAWLEFACCTAMRPGEIDALRWENVDFASDDIRVEQQFSATSWSFTPPKYGEYTCALVGRAREVLHAMPRPEGDVFVFTTIAGRHYTPSSRQERWQKVRAAAGLDGMKLYVATRHYFGWYAMNVLELDARDIAEQLGHKDGGRLVERLYGHPDRALRRARVRDAYNAQTAHVSAHTDQ